MELIMLEQLKSEGARMGFLGLSIETLLERSKKSVELEYHKIKSKCLNRLDRIRTKSKESEKAINSLDVEANWIDFSLPSVIALLVLIVTGVGLIYLCDNMLFPGINDRNVISIGMIVGACALGGLLLNNDNLQATINKKLFVSLLAICAAVLTVLATMVSADPQTIVLSLTLGSFVGIVVYLMNILLVPTLVSFFTSIKFLWLRSKSWLLGLVQHYRKVRVANLSNKIQSIDMLIYTKTGILESEIQHEYELGIAASNIEKSTTKIVMEEKTNVLETQYVN